MICDNCKETVDGGCLHYTRAGMESFDRRGYCPFADVGPNKVVTLVAAKVRKGQQKSKTKKG